MDTIFALASARGKAGVSVIRVSGPNAFNALIEFGVSKPPPRQATLCALKYNGELLDRALALIFEGPASFTGEDVVELHLHGSIAITAAVESALSGLAGFRQAEPGEFTRRALENEKLDLAQVEGLADLIEAETEAQRQQAIRVLSGALGDKAADWRTDLVRAAALIEATIDFAEEDVPEDVYPEVSVLLERVWRSIAGEHAGVGAAERIREGFEVAIVGRPNVGKSTLLNFLAGREAAITSEIAGTTRDVIEVRMDVKGLPVTFLDTAGVRSSDDKIEALGVERAIQRARSADVCVILIDGKDDPPPIEVRPDDIVLIGKSDLREGDISAMSGKGVDGLIERLGQTLEDRVRSAGVAIRERHRAALGRALGLLESSRFRLQADEPQPEIVAEELRNAIAALDSLVGKVDVEHLLDEIFSSFCIGK